MEDQRDEGLLGVSALNDMFKVVGLTLTVLIMVAVLACIVGAVIYSVKCCTRRHQAELEIQLEDNFKLVEKRVQAQRAARKAAARARAV